MRGEEGRNGNKTYFEALKNISVALVTLPHSHTGIPGNFLIMSPLVLVSGFLSPGEIKQSVLGAKQMKMELFPDALPLPHPPSCSLATTTDTNGGHFKGCLDPGAWDFLFSSCFFIRSFFS